MTEIPTPLLCIIVLLLGICFGGFCGYVKGMGRSEDQYIRWKNK